jgi:GntR family transcriptional repressor for pyruvate dehydrogenase complex
MSQDMFKEVRQRKITQKIIDQIRSAILEGKLAPGDKLPPEKELVGQFQVSKQTLREAMRALEHIGLIDVRKGVGGGAFIIEVDIQVTKQSLANYLYFKNLTIEDLSEFRRLMEPYAARRAAEQISAAELEKLKALNDAARENLRRRNMAAARRDEFNFHRFLADVPKNPLIVLVLDFAESLLDDFKKLFEPDTAFFESVQEAHDRIYDAVARGDPQRAFDEMHQHIVQVEAQLVKLKEDINLKKLYAKIN